MARNPLAAHPYWRQLLIVSVLVPVVAVAAVLAFAWPAARTAPRDLPVGLVAGPATEQLSIGLERAVPGGFDLRLYPDTAAAQRAIGEREIYGALAVRDGTLTVYESSAAGVVVAQLLTRTGAELAQASGTTSRVVDTVPLSAADPRGSVLTSTLLPLVLGSIVVGAVVALLLAAARLWQRVLALAAASAATALGVLLIAQGFLGALPDNQVATWAGLTLGVSAVAGAVAGVVSLIGPAGLGATAPLLIFVGNAFSGSSSAPQLLPDSIRVIGQLLPPGAALSLIRGTAYFDGNGIAAPLTVLTGWLVFGLAAMGAGHYRRARRATGAHELPAALAVVDDEQPRHALAAAH